jgi:hypothetical protein
MIGLTFSLGRMLVQKGIVELATPETATTSIIGHVFWNSAYRASDAVMLACCSI